MRAELVCVSPAHCVDSSTSSTAFVCASRPSAKIMLPRSIPTCATAQIDRMTTTTNSQSLDATRKRDSFIEMPPDWLLLLQPRF